MRLYERMRREDLATARLEEAAFPAEPLVPAAPPVTPAAAERPEPVQKVTPLSSQRGRSEAG
jgi:hypothetical protein